MASDLAINAGDYSLAFIIEWDNARLCETSRCGMMLHRLRLQFQELLEKKSASTDAIVQLPDIRTPIEIIFVFDSTEVDEPELRTFVQDIFDFSDNRFQIRFLGAAGMVYFELKNYGFQHTQADLVMFLDSDVIPEDGWLVNMIGSFSNPKVEVVAGNPYVELNGFYSKAFALAWFFPLRSQERVLKPFYKFWANNVAFRRETFSRFHFPQLQGYYRGSCMQLVQKLQENDVTIYLNTAAQVSHPAPNGLGYFLSKGLAQGRNDLLTRQVMEAKRYSLRQSFVHFKKLLAEKLRLIARDRTKVDLSLPGTFLAMSITAIYYSLYLTGEMMTHLSPTFMAKRFKV